MSHISIKSPLFLAIALAFGAAAVGSVLLSTNAFSPAGASNYFVQSAEAEALHSRYVSAELRRDPSPGDMLVAVVSNGTSSAFTAPPGWEVALSETEATPGLAILYRFATEVDTSRIDIGGFAQYTDLALEVYEFRGLDVELPPILTTSAQGEGRDMELGSIQSAGKDAVAIIAAATDGRNFVRHWEPSEFEPRREMRTRGSGSVSLASGELVIEDGKSVEVSARSSTATRWQMQAVVFSVASELTAATNTEALKIADNLSLTTEVSNSAPEEGEELTYVIDVTNSGDAAVTNLEIATHLPKQVALKEAVVGSGWYMPYANLWYIGELGPGETAELELVTVLARGTEKTSFIFKPSVLYFDQYVEGEVDIWDAASVDVSNLTVAEARELGEEEACEAITSEELTLNNNEEETESSLVTVSATASAATSVLLNTREDITSAVLYPLGTSSVLLEEGYGEKELFAWFISPCTRSFIQRQSIRLVDPELEPEASETVEQGAEEALLEPEEEEEETVDTDPEGDSPFVSDDELDQAEEEANAPEQDEGQAQAPAAGQATTIPAACVPAAPFLTYLYAGSTGSEVERLQGVLACLGYYGGPIDGVFDAEVTQSVIGVQAAYGLTVSGAMNLSTRELLSGY